MGVIIGVGAVVGGAMFVGGLAASSEKVRRMVEKNEESMGVKSIGGFLPDVRGCVERWVVGAVEKGFKAWFGRKRA